MRSALSIIFLLGTHRSQYCPPPHKRAPRRVLRSPLDLARRRKASRSHSSHHFRHILVGRSQSVLWRTTAWVRHSRHCRSWHTADTRAAAHRIGRSRHIRPSWMASNHSRLHNRHFRCRFHCHSRRCRIHRRRIHHFHTRHRRSCQSRIPIHIHRSVPTRRIRCHILHCHTLEQQRPAAPRTLTPAMLHLAVGSATAALVCLAGSRSPDGKVGWSGWSRVADLRAGRAGPARRGRP
mmetsp:Transcript_10439/g.28819  ORF Transcript_10439/g.28819 Transcript_10439/m.28819 type:complete len:236 (-) Transcript_10439:1039-1746(-)